MDINAYSTYSILSMSEKKNSTEFQEILAKIEKFNELHNIESAKTYLKNTWDISGSSSCTIGTGIAISVSEKKNSLIVKFAYSDENISYYYNK